MNKNEICNLIASSIDCNKKARVYFHLTTRTPMFGKFVKLEDHNDLVKKDMIRFVSEAHVDEFNSTDDIRFTRIFQFTSFEFIKLF